MFRNKICKAVLLLFSCIMLTAYILILLKDFIPHAHPIQFPINSFWVGGLSLVLGSGIYYFYKYRSHTNNYNDQRKSLFLITCIIFILQIFIFYEIYFIINADTEVIVNCAKQVYTKPKEWYDNIGWYNDYFSTYPNNFAIMIFYSYIINVEQTIGFLDVEEGYMLITFIHCIISNLSAIFLFKLIQRMTMSNIIAWASYGIYVVLVLLSPWLAVPYADQVCLAFPIMTLYAYDNVNRKIHTKLNVVSIIFSCIICLILKPLVIIAGIAIFIIEITQLISRFSIKRFFALLSILLFIFLSVQAGNMTSNKWALDNGMNIDDRRALSVSHFLMMGLNEENPGAYYADDVTYSKSFATVKERNAGCLLKAKERIENMGVWGVLVHTSKKVISSLADSSFGYKILHIGRVRDVPPQSNISLMLRSWLRSDGRYYKIISIFHQVIWEIVLLFNLGNMMSIFINKNQSNVELAMELTIMGFILFEVLFESQCHHIFSMVSVFILSGAIGFSKVCVKVSNNE